MSFNNGNERRKLNAEWKHLRVQYREAGMSEDAIQTMYEFNLSVLNSERAYAANTVAVCDSYNDVDTRITQRARFLKFSTSHNLQFIRESRKSLYF